MKQRHSKAKRARLDAKGDAKPLTAIIGKFPNNGNCYGPHSIPDAYELLDVDPNKGKGK